MTTLLLEEKVLCHECHNDIGTETINLATHNHVLIETLHVCSNCAVDKFSWCSNCGHPKRVNEIRKIGGHLWCEACYAHNFKACAHCKKICYVDNLRTIDNLSFCRSCSSQLFARCVCCGVTFPKNLCLYASNIGVLCETCHKEQTSHCDICGELELSEHLHEHRSSGNMYCRACYEQNKIEFQALQSNTCIKTNYIDRYYSVEVECIATEADNVTSNYVDITDDGSISAEDGSGEEHRIGILQGDKGIELLEYHLGKLADSGYRVNKSCGLHVHVDSRKLSKTELFNVVTFIQTFDDVIFSLVPRSRKETGYCDTFINFDAQKRENYADNVCTFFEDISRYHGFNFKSFFEHGTLEFRYHGGTINYEKIKNWVVLCLAIVEHGRKREWKRLRRLPQTAHNLRKMMAYLKLTADQKEYFMRRFYNFKRSSE